MNSCSALVNGRLSVPSSLRSKSSRSRASRQNPVSNHFSLMPNCASAFSIFRVMILEEYTSGLPFPFLFLQHRLVLFRESPAQLRELAHGAQYFFFLWSAAGQHVNLLPWCWRFHANSMCVQQSGDRGH